MSIEEESISGAKRMNIYVDEKNNNNYIGVQVVLFEPNGTLQNLWLPGGHPQGHYVFDLSELKDFYIEAYGGKWYAVCNGNTTFVNSSATLFNNICLEGRQLFVFRTENNVNYIIYVEEMTSQENVFLNYKLINGNEICIGRTSDNDIQYDIPYVSSSQAILKKEDNRWNLQDLGSLNGTYVNGKRVQQCTLNLGDVIYIIGLKIIVGTDFISINNQGRPVYVDSNRFVLLEESFDNNVVDCIDLEEKYFDRQPRRRQPLVHAPISIEGPPMSMNGNKMPLMLRMGSSMVMGSTAMLAGNFTTMLSSVLFPMLTNKYTEKERKEYEGRRVAEYTKYLAEKELEIYNECHLEESVLNWNYPDIETILKFVSDGKRLWERKKTDDDFLLIRVGKGSAALLSELKYPQERFTIDEDELECKMRELAEREHIIQDVPIQTSLIQDYIVGVSGNDSLKIEFVKRLLLQLTILHSYDEVKIIVLGNESVLNELSYMRYLPHVWNNQKTFRFLASNSAEAFQISEYLKKELDQDLNNQSNRKEFAKKRPYYIVFALDKKVFESMEILKLILQEEYMGVSIWAVFDDLPKECSKIFQLNSDRLHEIVYLKQLDHEMERFQFDSFDEKTVKNSMKILSNTYLKVVTEAYSLPKSVTFLEMYGVGKIEHLNIAKRWKSSNPVSSLAVPVGVATDGSQFTLDLHEKFQGPHGLIAGMTGSGKSEFIITYILSLAVNFHPDEVGFILIDYKGGGLAGAFDDEKNGIHLPHLMGTITNLDGSAIQRSLVSIQSELTRRQRVFQKVKSQVNEGTMDIYNYQKLYRNGIVTEPMPHLFIISDEFAELKKQQPEFMDQLISAARIGRSLGIHLILATQKPTGVVNDQIISNTKFRVCLKVQDKVDSMEMLKRPEAAELKNIGSFYLQVGYNEFFALGQSAWCGAAYEPNDEILKAKDDSIQFIDCVGQTVHTIRKQSKKSEVKKKQLVEIVKTLSDIAIEEGIEAKSLWKPPLPKHIDLDLINESYGKDLQAGKEDINVCLGMLDNPMNQTQVPLIVDLQSCKNMMIVGESGSGKTTLIQSMLLPLVKRFSPKDINFYILDYSSRMLKLFNTIPHCGAVLCEDNDSDFDRFFDLILEILNERKKIFVELEVDSFNTARSIVDMPLILVIIDNYAGVCATPKGSDFQYKIQEFLKVCANYGIQIILSCSHLNEVTLRVKQELGTRICLHMKDRYDYTDAIGIRCFYEPPEYPGRGLCIFQGMPLEFQAAKYKADMDDKIRIQEIKNELKELKELYKTEKVAKRLPCIPEKETYDEFIKEIDTGRIPLGYFLQNAKKVSLPLKQFTTVPIYFGNQNGVKPVLGNIIQAIKRENADFTIIKSKYNSCFDDDESLYREMSISDFASLLECNDEQFISLWTAIGNEVEKRRNIFEEYCERNNLNTKKNDIYKETYDYMKKNTVPYIVLFENYIDFCNSSSESTVAVFSKIFKIARKYNMYFIGCLYPDEDKNAIGHELIKAFYNEQLVLLFGGNLDKQSLTVVPMQLIKNSDDVKYNNFVMKYNQKFYSLVMPCGELKEDVVDLDDKNIFE